MECPKCHYQRLPSDDAPDWQCPACGIAYQKFSAQAKSSTVTSVALSDDERPNNRFRNLRILVLLLILLAVAVDAWLTQFKATSWQQPLQVVIYPINGDGSAEAAAYIQTMQRDELLDIEQFMLDEVSRYELKILDPLDIHLGPIVTELPPALPQQRNIFNSIVWSLKLRYWASSVDQIDHVDPDIRIFVLYHKLEKNKRLEHSTGLQKGMIGVVHAFADSRMHQRNNVVIAHEMLHTLGATDKYDLATGLPIYPQGYAEPRLSPRYPQQFAEIMGGKIPKQVDLAKMPESLSQALIGETTAVEIGWGSDLR